MRTQERLLVDARWTWKPYRVAYEVIRALRGLDTGSVVEVITKDDTGLLNDLGVWCRATGHELLSERPGQEEVRLLIRKGEPVRNERTMTVIMSTASLEYAVFPLEKALAGAVLGMDVAVVFEGAGVRLLKRGYRPRLSGLVGGLFTSKVEGVMKKEIGWPLPQESILILEDLGARFYICSPSLFGYGVHEQDLIVGKYTLGAVVTWADLLARSDIQIFSKAQFDKP
ncbi:MAG TPA: DsrE family protein [Streptosporangiaceae bacterium]|nr:DsrE family protein [Streptosporangiaceae bacterium]